MNFFKDTKIFFIIGLSFFLFLGFFAFRPKIVMAANVGDIANFNVDKEFDTYNRTQIPATLVKINSRLYFYFDKSWWDLQGQDEKNQIYKNLEVLSNEFDSNIYPVLTSTFGYEWNPGIDKDARISVLFEQINSAESGYFREVDEYDRLQVPTSNEKEMLYLSVDVVKSSNAKVILAHEFMHLITFNQKNKIFGKEEDTWLNEARADYSSTILGYDDKYEGSNLQVRVADFIQNPSDSIVEWMGTKYDYASVSLLTHYLVDQYGLSILIASLKSEYVGIESINYALQKSASQDKFGQVFANWTIASILNDCSVGQKYCYINPYLKKIKIVPTLIFMPLVGDVSLSVSNVTKVWSGNWQKFIGGNGDLELEFIGLKGLNFYVPYIIENLNGGYSVKFMELGKDTKGNITLPDFRKNINSLIVMPSLQIKSSGFDEMEPSYPYNYTVKISGKINIDEQNLIQQLTTQIESLKKQIAAILEQHNSSNGSQNSIVCSRLTRNLYFGMSNNDDVKCLQQFLKNQGTDIYPEGLVTGNFASLTKTAVIKFQEKYATDILAPVGLLRGTGYVGVQTREKINQILSGR